MRLIAAAGAVLSLALLAAGAAQADDRNVSVTPFTKLVVQGGYSVTVTAGPPSARLSGAPGATDSVSLDQTGETLFVRGNGMAGEHGRGPVSVTLTTPALSSVELAGAGNVSVDRLSGDRGALVVAGDGAVSVADVETAKLGITVRGAGNLTAGGHARDVGMLYQGAGTVHLDDLTTDTLSILASGTGRIVAQAKDTASINAQGTITVTVAGEANCQVKNAGSGNVICGKDH